jgi:FecR protein
MMLFTRCMSWDRHEQMIGLRIGDTIRLLLIKGTLVTLALSANIPAVFAEAFNQAEVTKTVNLVSLLRAAEAVQPASVGDIIKGETALKTGEKSRAELEFPDRTITRVGSTSLFRFAAGARLVTLDGGTMLFSSPRGSGGGEVQAGAITAAVSGTDFIVSYVKGLATKGGHVQVICLTGTVHVYFTAEPAVRRSLGPGQMIEIPNGAKELPAPTNVSLSQILSTNELFQAGGFRPLYSQALLEQIAARQPSPVVESSTPKSRDEQALRLAIADLNWPTLDASVVIEAVGYVANNPKSVEILMEEAARILAKDEDRFLAIVAEVAKAYPSLIVSIAKGSAKGAPFLAPRIAATLATLFPNLAMVISKAITQVVPAQARLVALAVAAVVPDRRDLIFAAVRSASESRLNLAALGFATGQPMNPADLVNGLPPVLDQPDGDVITPEN